MPTFLVTKAVHVFKPRWCPPPRPWTIKMARNIFYHFRVDSKQLCILCKWCPPFWLQRPCTCLSPDIVPPSVNNINGRKYIWNTQRVGWVGGCETHLFTSHGTFICRGAITQQIYSYNLHTCTAHRIHKSYTIVNGLCSRGRIVALISWGSLIGHFF